MRLTQFLNISSLGLSFLIALGGGASASPLKEYLKTESGSINTCLLSAMEVWGYAQLEKRTQLENVSLAKVNDCLDLATPYFADNVKLNVSFENLAFSNHVSMNGIFAFSPSALEDNIVSEAELSEFQAIISPNNNSTIFRHDSQGFNLRSKACILSGVEEFSYAVSAEHGSALKIDSLLFAANHIAGEGYINAEIDALTRTLSALQTQLSTAKESSSQLNLTCKSEAVEVAIVDNLADAVVVQNRDSGRAWVSSSHNIPPNYSFPRDSASIRMSLSFGSSSATLTSNEHILKIDTRHRHNRVEAAFKSLPLILDDEVVSSSPAQDDEFERRAQPLCPHSYKVFCQP